MTSLTLLPSRIGRRLRRIAGRRPAAGADILAVTHVIDRYTVFDGMLHIAGRLHADRPIVGLALALPDGTLHRLRTSPASGTAVSFDDRIAVAAPIADIARAALRVRGNGAEATVAAPGAPVDDPVHRLTGRFLERLHALPAGRLLEVGSRARSGVSRGHWVPPGWSYSGFDILAGPNVDVAGDAHRLSAHYPAGSIDVVMAFSVLEHLLMPWKVAVELNRVMRLGALGYFTTHQSWPLHDEPWDFWRFSDRAWAGLLNAATGFEIVAVAMGEPCHLVAQRCHLVTAFGPEPAGRLASAVLFRKVAETTLDWPVDVAAVTDTAYPSGEAVVF